MSAARLREAASGLREEWGGPNPMGTAWHRERDLHLAVADWLDTAGADLWAHGPLCGCARGCHDCDDDMWQPHVRRALAVADAYLGT